MPQETTYFFELTLGFLKQSSHHRSECAECISCAIHLTKPSPSQCKNVAWNNWLSQLNNWQGQCLVALLTGNILTNVIDSLGMSYNVSCLTRWKTTILTFTIASLFSLSASLLARAAQRKKNWPSCIILTFSQDNYLGVKNVTV